MVTFDFIKENLNYNPETGVFTWIKSGYGRQLNREAGTIAGNGYREIRLLGKRISASRLAWLYVNKTWPLNEIDHIDGNSLNNKWSNLREATREQNNYNRSSTVNKSGCKGVFITKCGYMARI